MDLLPVIKGTTPNDASGGAGVLGLRRGLVIVQVALSAVLLVGAGLFLRTLVSALSVAPGYDIDRVLLTTVDFGAAGIAAPAAPPMGERMLSEVRAVPGVEAAAFGHIIPFSGAFVSRPAAPESEPLSNDRENDFLVPYAVVSPDYFRTLGMALRGRDFTPSDGAQAPRVMIINDTLAQRHWPGQDPIGKRMKLSAAAGSALRDRRRRAGRQVRLADRGAASVYVSAVAADAAASRHAACSRRRCTVCCRRPGSRGIARRQLRTFPRSRRGPCASTSTGRSAASAWSPGCCSSSAPSRSWSRRSACTASPPTPSRSDGRNSVSASRSAPVPRI